MKHRDTEELRCQAMKQVRPQALCERKKYVLSNIPFPSSFSQNHGVLPSPQFSRKKIQMIHTTGLMRTGVVEASVANLFLLSKLSF